MKLLEVPTETVEQAVSQMLTSGFLLLEEIDSEPLIFLPHLRKAEDGIATKIKRLAAAGVTYPKIDFEKAVAWCETKTGNTLAPSQREALKTALTSRVVIITGGPGVGKTTLVNSILKILRAKKVKCLLCAPTGRAAKRLTETTGMEAKTIHRLLEVDPATGRFQRNEDKPLDCELLIVDETSMVDVLLMYALLRALPKTSALIMVGDVDQLPSVGPGNALRDLIDSGVIPVVRLTEVFRQAASSKIITGAHLIRQGKMPELRTAESGSDFHFIERETPEEIAATLVRLVQDRIPKGHRLGLSEVIVGLAGHSTTVHLAGGEEPVIVLHHIRPCLLVFLQTLHVLVQNGGVLLQTLRSDIELGLSLLACGLRHGDNLHQAFLAVRGEQLLEIGGVQLFPLPRNLRYLGELVSEHEDVPDGGEVVS